MCLVDDVVLLVRPGTLLDGRVQVVMPSLPALLPDAALQVLRDQGPSLGTVLLHQLDDLLIFLQGKEVQVISKTSMRTTCILGNYRLKVLMKSPLMSNCFPTSIYGGAMAIAAIDRNRGFLKRVDQNETITRFQLKLPAWKARLLNQGNESFKPRSSECHPPRGPPIAVGEARACAGSVSQSA